MAIPTLVQNTVCTAVVSESGVALFAGTTYGCGFPSGTQANNAILCAVKWNVTGNYTVGISDDRDNPYNLAIDMASDGNEYVSVYYALGVAPGTKMITFTFSGGLPSDTQAGCSEFYGVTATVNGALDDGELEWQCQRHDPHGGGSEHDHSERSDLELGE